jgi:formylglycine-generating enzyme required for sulfatase activity
MRLFISIVFTFSVSVSLASDIEISNCIFQDNQFGTENAFIKAVFTVTWKNAWHTDKNYDAAWIFFKLNNANETRSQRHGLLKQGSARLVTDYFNSGVSPSFWVPGDGAGLMVYASQKYMGQISWRMSVEIDVRQIKNLNLGETVFADAHAIEMVYIPQSAFYIGTADTLAHRNTAAFYTAGSKQPYYINNESTITVGNQNGNLTYYNANEPQYKGDMQGPVPAGFPKGYEAFYCMKYELNEGQYTSFLNSTSEYFTSNRAHISGRNYTDERGSIYLEHKTYKTKNPQRPASFLSFDDDCAFADWAGLRPMTELEFEKACRGPFKPTVNEYPWGNNSREKVSRYYTNNGDLVMQHPLDEKDLNDSNLELFGASYYWVMDLNKSLWERCVSVGNPKGREFKGTHGDGMLAGYYGNATNADWPNGFDGKGGISYRGGGVYESGMVGSPEGKVSDRSFGAWGDGPSTIAYGFRAVRGVK